MTRINKPTEDRRQPSKKQRKAVAVAFDPNALKAMCVRTDFSAYAERYDCSDTTEAHPRFFYYQDNGSDVLAIAHLDSVQRNGVCNVVDTAAGLLATSGTLDDRLGAYVILELLPKLGIVCDVLLTTDEEIADSTAADFYINKRYNWMFQFDRGGTDVVMYDYETPELCALVEDAGGRVGVGSFSDICQLEHLGCAGFNWGVGYQDYHGPRAHAWLDDTFKMVARFVKFYKANANIVLAHDEPADEPAWLDGTTSTAWDDDDVWRNSWKMTANCGHEIDIDDERSFVEYGSKVYCTKCGSF